MDAQDAMMNEQNQQDAHTIRTMDTNNGTSNGHVTNGNIVITSSAGEPSLVVGQNVITTVMATTNGGHPQEMLQERGSPEMQSPHHQLPPTPMTPNSATEIDLSRVKVEPESMNVIVKQEVINTGGE